MHQSMRIEPVTPTSPPEWFAQLAEIHSAEIHGGFLTKLGPRFLHHLYQEMARSPHTFLFAAVNRDEVVGFIAGSVATGRFYRQYLWRRGLRDAWILLPKLITLSRIKSAVETLLYPSRNRDAGLPSAEILNFCVRRTMQRSGVGKRLFHELISEFQRRGVASIRIVTGAEQVKAQRFYESLGAVRISSIEVHRGTQSIVYTFCTAGALLPAA
jgi:ribosomal protein S18 acetylase RimI-like enzyme